MIKLVWFLVLDWELSWCFFCNGNYAQRLNINFNFVFCRKPRLYMSFQPQSISRFLQLMSGRTWQFSNLQMFSGRTVVSPIVFALIKTRFVFIPFLTNQRYSIIIFNLWRVKWVGGPRGTLFPFHLIPVRFQFGKCPGFGNSCEVYFGLSESFNHPFIIRGLWGYISII